MKNDFVVGSVRRFKRFGYINKMGGTGQSDVSYGDPLYNETVLAKIVKRWVDDETGERCWCIPLEVQENKNVFEFLYRVARTGMNLATFEMNNHSIPIDKFVLFCSEHDLVEEIVPKGTLSHGPFKVGVDFALKGGDFHIETKGEIIKSHMEGDVKVIDEFRITSVNIVPKT